MDELVNRLGRSLKETFTDHFSTTEYTFPATYAPSCSVQFRHTLRYLFSLRVAFDFLLEPQVLPCKQRDRMIEPWKWSLLADGSLMLPSRPPGSALTTRISVTLDPRIEVFRVF